MKLAANLTFLFGSAPTWERIDAAADAGFTGVELLQPYAEDADDLRHTLEAAGPTLVLINTPEPDWESGERGCAAIPGAEDRFRAGLDQAMAFAEAAACPRIHLLAGLAEGDAAHDTYLSNLDHAARHAPDMVFTIEPLNAEDQPGYFLSDFEQAAEILKHLNHPNLGLQFDSYHAEKITGDATATWQRYRHLVTHVQIAGPGRGAPSPETTALVRRMLQDGYTGWISAEYLPSGPTNGSLDWMSDLP